MDVATGHVLWRLSHLLHAEAIAGPVVLDDEPLIFRETYLALRAQVAREMAWLQRYARPEPALWADRGMWN